MNISAQDIYDSEAWTKIVERVRLDLMDAFSRVDPINTEELQDVAYRFAAISDIHDTIEMIAREERSEIIPTPGSRGAQPRPKAALF